jgi:hypothetical protein
MKGNRGCTEVSNSVAELAKEVGRRALKAIFDDPSTGRWLKGIQQSKVKMGEIVLDVETSRHMTDDRELLEISLAGPDFEGFMHVDIVHHSDGDRRGRCIFFEISYNGHELQGTVCLPHSQDGGKAFVTSSEDDELTEELGNLTEEDDEILVYVRRIEHIEA